MVTHGNQDTRPRRSPQGSEGPTREANKIGASTPYDFESKNRTASGGLLPVATLLEKLGFQQLLEETLRVKRITRVMSLYQFVLAMVLALYVGFSRLNHLRFLEREPMLVGILKVWRLPPQCTFWRFLASLHLQIAQQLLEVQRSMRQRVNKAAESKAQLLQYNRDDCCTLRRIFESIRYLASPDSLGAAVSQIPFKAAQTDDLQRDHPRWDMFKPREYASEDFKKVAHAAYFDYQRERVYVRTHPHFNVVNKKHRKFTKVSSRANTLDSIESQRCPKCRSNKINKGKQMSYDLIDLKFFKGGIKKWITRVLSWHYRCLKCNHVFSSGKGSRTPRRYGHGLLSWFVYSNVACGFNMNQVQKSVSDVFGLAVPYCESYRAKSYLVTFYHCLYSEILKSILASPVLHIDETTVALPSGDTECSRALPRSIGPDR